MADRLWCPTRGYFDIGAGGAETAPAEAAGAETPAPAAAASPAVQTGAAAAGGGKAWAPTRGWFAVGKAGSPVPAAPAAAAATDTKVAAASESTPAAGAREAAAPKEASTAKKKAPAAKAKKAPQPAPAAVAADDKERNSVTAVPGLTESAFAKGIVDQVYDEPDSETTLYRIPALNVMFFLMSVALLVVVVLVMWQDYARPWKSIQADWNDELVATYEQDLTVARTAQASKLDALLPSMEGIVREVAAKVEGGVPDVASGVAAAAALPDPALRFESLLELARSLLREEFGEYQTRQDALAEAKKAFYLKDKEVRAFRGTFMAEKFVYEERKRHALDKLGDTAEARAEVAEVEAEFGEIYVVPLERLEAEAEDLEGKVNDAQGALDHYVGQQANADGRSLLELEKELGSLTFESNQIAKSIDLIEANWKNTVRNLPMLDFLAPSYKIEKVVTDGLHEDLQLLTMPRVDRCKTCHINIDNADPVAVDFESDDWGTVYQSHPRLDLFVGSASPHPYQQFGCTVCHFGDGRATDFTRAAHTPSDHAQEEEWRRKYGWHELHHQDWPMLEKRYVSSSCGKCHEEQHRLQGGDGWNRGYELVKTYGCFACHKLDGFADEPKAGPNLTHVADKTDLGFLTQWIRRPEAFRSSARMPRFFDLTNTGGGTRHDWATATGERDGRMLFEGVSAGELRELDFASRNAVEVLALATYLGETSTRRTDVQALGLTGDPVAGREVFRTSGCLGCHSVRVESMTPELGGTPEALTALLDAARAELTAARESAAERESKATAALGAARVENRAAWEAELLAAQAYVRNSNAAAGGLEALADFLSTLAVGLDVEELYRQAVVPAERLETAGADVASVKQAADAIRARWIHNNRAPDLSGIGSKIRSADWLADWIIDPRRHDPDTIMPRLRIEDDPGGQRKIANIVAYLMSLRDSAFESRPEIVLDTDPERELLREIAYEYLKQDFGRRPGRAAARTSSERDLLVYVGNRMVKRYGCFGCHNGIADTVFTAGEGGAIAWEVQGNMDAAQRIGTELNGWGSKLPGQLDFGLWGHQHSGRDAIPHKNRYAWAEAKLTDTRRFDVLPAEKLVEEGVYAYETTRRLIQKRPDELLKMPLFPFHDDAEQVEALVTYVAGLVTEPVGEEMKRKLDSHERIIEKGSRLIERLSCQGCHRIGVDNQYLPLDELPGFSAYDEGVVAHFDEMEKETWLTESVNLLGKKKADAEGLTLPVGTLLGQLVYDLSSMSMDDDDDSDDEELSVVELARRNAEVRGVPRDQQLLPVGGYHEGGMRFYFGTDATTRSLAPPPLVRQGERVRSEWLFQFLLNVEPVRPWLSVKMPSFHLTQEDSRTLVRWFKARSELPSDGEAFAADSHRAELVQKGAKVFGNEEGGLQCTQCHPVGEKLPTLPVLEPADRFDWREFLFSIPVDTYWVVWKDGDEYRHKAGFASTAAGSAWLAANVPEGSPAAVGQPWSKDSWGPDLNYAAARLRPDWMRLWVTNPQDFMPGTKMPNFFGAPDPTVPLEEEPFPTADDADTIRALVQYLVHMKKLEAAGSAESD